MSAKMEEPPEGLELVDEDTRLKRLDEWSKNLVSLARILCNHEDGQDPRGHAKRPCAHHMKVVRHITECWFTAMHLKANAAALRAQAEGLEQPLVTLQEAFYIASAVLDPAVSVSLPDWGPA